MVPSSSAAERTTSCIDAPSHRRVTGNIPGSDIDRHGVKVLAGANGVWYVDSTFYHIQGDGIQVGDQVNSPASAINKVYIGRNRAYENLQSCFWTKNATDVIMSENICSDITFSPGGDGQGLGGQYDPNYVWFLSNTVYNTKAGIKVSGPNIGGGGPWYMIGNKVYSVQSDSCSNYGVGALTFQKQRWCDDAVQHRSRR